jgi:acetyl esterase/lipase
MSEVTRRTFLGTAAITAAAPALDVFAQGRGTQGQRGQGPGGQAPAGPPVPLEGVTVEKDMVYGKGGAMDLRLDVYKPRPGTEKRAATVHIHGGGFTGGSKDTMNERILPFAKQGYVAIASQYRLLGQSPWPGMLEDVKAAIRWTRANASRLNIDPARIIIVGYSAGGYLALTVAGTQNKAEMEGSGGNAGAGTQVEAAVAFYPVVDSGPPPSAAPTTYIGASYAPTVIFHGVADTTVPIESSQRLFQRLRDGKVPSELHTFEGAEHVFDRDPSLASACGSLADLFITRQRAKART